MSGFDDVIGYENIKNEMRIICDALRNPENYKKMGVNIPKGVLFFGEPGIGKSLMAKAVIKECGRRCFVIRKDRPDGMFVDHIRNVFEEAEKQAPSIIFLDDMDKFSNGDDRRKNEEEYVTIQSCIDELCGADVFVIATVNDRDILPDSLLRPGRFDKVIAMRSPKGKEAEQIIAHYLKDKKISNDVNASEIAGILEGKTCADLETIINEAGICAAYKHEDLISREEMIRACMRYMFEAPESAEEIDDEEKRNLAIHEAGHAVIGELFNPGSVTLVTISGYEFGKRGITKVNLPSGYWLSQKKMEERVIGILGGRAASEVYMETVDVGASNDISRAFDIVNRFVEGYCSYGFDSVGRFSASEIPKENRDRQAAFEVERYYMMAKKLILDNKEFMDAVIAALIEKHTLTAIDIKEIGESIKKKVV